MEITKELFKGKMKESYLNFLFPILEEHLITINKSIKEVATKPVYPTGDKIFAAFNQHELDDLKVVILGQDSANQF